MEPDVIFVHGTSWPERRVFFELDDAGLVVTTIRVEYVGAEWFERLVAHYTNAWGPPDEQYIWRQTIKLQVEGYVLAPSYEIAYWEDVADTRVEIKRYLGSHEAMLSFIDLRQR